MCTAKLYGHSTDTALCIDTRTNTKYCKVQQLTDSEYQDLQHHLLIPDRFLKRISDTICITTARNCQLDCHYCSASGVSSNYNNYPLSSCESNIHGEYFSLLV
jgi:sulfatase maturation enzyme AslB (radical SAM superfamily)